jgi:hypothetical protein
MKKFNFFRFLYISFVLLGIYYVVFKQDFIEASAQFGIALAFDPFDQKLSWKNRPTWQKVWLVIHLATTALFFGYGVGFADK